VVVSNTIAHLEAVRMEMNNALDIVEHTVRFRTSTWQSSRKFKKKTQESAGVELWVFNNV
jgi:hypothetical protein